MTIFATFQTPVALQHKVLTWGITGAVVLRALFIYTGVLLIERFTWLLALFGLFLVYTGGKALLEEFVQLTGLGRSSASHAVLPITNPSSAPSSAPSTAVRGALESNLLLRFLGKVIPMSTEYDPGGSFFVEASPSPSSSSTKPSWLCLRPTRMRATPLFAVLVIIETTDMVFAADSIPAVLSITQDPFIAYTSNVCFGGL